MVRPVVDVVVPFRGGRHALQELRARVGSLQLRPGDTIVVVDNTPGERPLEGAPGDMVGVLRATDRPTPGYARNQGAKLGSAEWLVFIDADTDPRADLLERYFDPPPAPVTALLAGGVIDEDVPFHEPAPSRYAYLRRTLSPDRTFALGRWSFGSSANMACRRAAFEAVGGFREDIRAAEDADLNYRLQAAGGAVERRDDASVIHRSRRSLRGFVAQAALHGAGAAWLSREYPGSFAPRRRPGLIWWALRFALGGCLRAARSHDRDELIRALFEPLWELSFEFGRSFSIEVPQRQRPVTSA